MARALQVTKGSPATLTDIPDADIGDGPVTIDVEWSSLNYKDALAITGRPGVIRADRLIPGIDLVGIVRESSDPEHAPGDRVLVNGRGLGETHDGGFATVARVPGDWPIRVPERFTSVQAAAIGTAGYTAALCVLPLGGITGSTYDGEILVTGATGGVGSIAIALLARAGHTEAAVDLTRLAGLTAAGVIGEVVHDDGRLMRTPALREFADEHGLSLVSIADLQVYRRLHESQVERLAETKLPTEFGMFTAIGYRDVIDGAEHIALVHGDPGQDRVLARLHSECLTGDVLGSRRCDCGPQLQASMAAITAEGAGIVVYLRGHEGRGIGLLSKLKAYALQDGGRDTVDANLDLGFSEDGRDYAAGAQILRDLGVTSVRLLTNNPDKATGLEAYGVKVAERLPLAIAATPDNLRYLQTKAQRMGHDLPELANPTGVDE